MFSSNNVYTALFLAILVLSGGIQEGDCFYIPGSATALAAAGSIGSSAAYAGGRFAANRFLNRRPGGFRDTFLGGKK